ncbi:MAG: alpha/beta hydrolase [bacterium]|nr:alpha/beta hydrolase [bacterium]
MHGFWNPGCDASRRVCALRVAATRLPGLSPAAVHLTRRALLRGAAGGAGLALLGGCRPGARATANPSPPPQEPPKPISATLPFERIAYGKQPQQFGDLRLPSTRGTRAPVVVVIHGGFWSSAQGLDVMTAACEALTYQGYATWNLEYRCLGDPGGGWPGTFLDVGAGLDQLRAMARRQPIDLRRLVTLGHSAGGQLALWGAGRRWIREGELRDRRAIRVQGAVSLAGLVDLRQAWDLGFDVVGKLLGGRPDEVPQRYDTASPAALLPLGVPQVLLHGRNDRVVPAQMSLDYQAVAVARGDQASLVSLDGVGHFELIEPETAGWAPVVEAVRQLC